MGNGYIRWDSSHLVADTRKWGALLSSGVVHPPCGQWWEEAGPPWATLTALNLPGRYVTLSHEMRQNATFGDLPSTTMWESQELSRVSLGTKSEPLASVLCVHPFCKSFAVESSRKGSLWTLENSATNLNSQNVTGGKVQCLRVQSACTAWESWKDISPHR